MAANPTNIFGLMGAGIASVAKNYVTEKKKTTPTNTTTQTKTTQTNAPAYNEHAQYIQQVHPGGLGAYTKLQNDRYAEALKSNNVDLLNKLQADSQKVGYGLSNPTAAPQVVAPIVDNSAYLDQIASLESALGNYQNQLQNIEMPKFNTSGMENVQDDLSSLLSSLESYQGADSMSMDESMARAYSQLNGIYNDNLDKTLNNYNKDAISRGMYGQLPVEALKANAISETELNKSKATNDLASNLFSQDYSMARQKDSDFYNKTSKQAGMLTNLYNTEADQYQNAMNEYLNTVNLASMQDSSFKDDIYSQLDFANNKYNATEKEKQKTLDTIGQYSSDFQAKINELTNDNDSSNDWLIPYLQTARQDKISGQNSAQVDSQNQQYKQAMDMFGKLGYASGWIADILGVPEGTTTASYANMQADNARIGSGGGGSGSGGGSDSGDSETEVFTIAQKQALYDDALALLKIQNPYKENFTQAEIEEAYNFVYKLRMSDPADMALQDEIEDEITSRTMTSDIKSGNLPGLNAIDGGSLYDLFK